MTVFVTQNHNKLDFTGLKKYSANIVYFYGRSLFPDEAEQSLLQAPERIRSVLFSYNFNPESDYLALVGDPILIAVCAAVMAVESRGSGINLLKFDRTNNTYFSARMPSPITKSPGVPFLGSLRVGQE